MINKKVVAIIFSVLISISLGNSAYMSNENFVPGSDGVIRMNINVIGHVKSPGNYLVNDNIDIMSALSVAGGYLPGANLKSISIYNQSGSVQKINLYDVISSDNLSFNQLDINPHDTIIVNQKMISRFFFSSNLPSMILSLINLAITLENTE